MSKNKTFTIPRLRERRELGNIYLKCILDYKNPDEIKYREILSKWVKDNPNEIPERWKWATEPNILVLFVSPKSFQGWWDEWNEHNGDDVNWKSVLPKLETHKMMWDENKGLQVMLKEGDSVQWCTIQEFIAMENDDHTQKDFVNQNTPIVPMNKKSIPQFLPISKPFFGSV